MTDVPKFHEFFAPGLRVLSDGSDRPARQVMSEASNLIGLDEEQRVQDLPSASLCRRIRRLLTTYRSPPDQQQSATLLVMQQAELLAAEVAA